MGRPGEGDAGAAEAGPAPPSTAAMRPETLAACAFMSAPGGRPIAIGVL